MGKEKFMGPKFDSFQQEENDFPHARSSLLRTFYYAKDCQHANNELLYFSKSGESSVLDMLMQGMGHEGLKKII